MTTPTHAERIARSIAATTDPTALHNLTHLQRFLNQQTTAATTGDTCPTCGGGVNPTILRNFGHCLKCQNATVGQ